MKSYRHRQSKRDRNVSADETDSALNAPPRQLSEKKASRLDQILANRPQPIDQEPHNEEL